MNKIKNINSDFIISLNSEKKNIIDIAKKINLDKDQIILYGDFIAKIDVNKNEKNLIKENSSKNLILVTSINPTSAGEGKSTITIGLNDALNRLGKKSIVTLREPSLGPVLGRKGGATGGGYAQVVPMDKINLYFTGDLYAITTAHNALSSFIYNHIFQGNELDIEEVVFNKVIDMNSRELRNIKLYANKKDSINDSFDITAASEIMAILCLANSLIELRKMLSNILVGYNSKKEPIFVKDLKIEGMLVALLKDAFMPNLVQTLENNPAIIHGGPFANIAHGCNSIVATKTALNLADIVITEAGFGADLGCEKFINIKCRKSGLYPNAIVLVVTIRAIKLHGNITEDELDIENLDALEKGIENVEKHVENIKKMGVAPIIALNKFNSDTDNEISFIQKWAIRNKLEISVCDVFNNGGEGAIDLANTVIKNLDNKVDAKFIYKDEDTVKKKTEIICKEIYGASNVIFSEEANKDLENIKRLNFDYLPVVIAKTPDSLSSNPKLKGRPKNFDINISRFKIKSGAGFIVAYTSNILTMPGLPKYPNGLKIDLDDEGNIENIY